MMVHERLYFSRLFRPEKVDRLLDVVDAYLLTERNTQFVEAAIPLLDRGGAVIAVGAYHLPRSDGLISLLRAAGYAVERVVLEGESPS